MTKHSRANAHADHGSSARPQPLPKQMQQIQRCIEQSDFAGAIRQLRPLLEIYPYHEILLRMYGIALQRSGSPAAAIAAFERRAELLPKDADSWNDLGYALLESGRSGDAIAHFERALRIDRGQVPARFNLARTLKAESRYAEAEQELLKLVDTAAGHLGAWVVLGDVQKALGRVEQAAKSYRAAVAVKPDYTPAWWSLSNLKTVRLSDRERQRLTAVADAREHDEYAQFALAKALEDQRQYDQAWQRFEMANRVKRAKLRWDAQGFKRWMERVQAAFEDRRWSVAEDIAGEARPVFIVSLPRSGSTLTEQLLGAHPAVTAADELPHIPQLIGEYGRRCRQPFVQWAAAATASQWRELGRAYLQRCGQWSRRTPVFCDKLPGNWVYIGAILSMFPQALIVDCRRDSRDTCVSCYRQLFVRGQEFSYQLDELAAYYRSYRQTMAFWYERAPDRIFDVRYEDLVTAPEAVARRLLDFCQLDWDESVLTGHRHTRPVATASAAQVREPIHDRNIGAWRRYESRLDVLIDALNSGASAPPKA